MMWQNLTITWSFVTIGVILLSFLGLTIWWIIRIKQKRLWLPTLRIIELQESRLPNLKFRPPEWVAFLCFLALCAIFVFFSMQPVKKVVATDGQERRRIHLFIDLSPSTSARLPLQKLAQKILTAWDSLHEGHLTISTSHSSDIVQLSNREELENYIVSIGYHRSGVLLGSAIKPQLEKLGKIDRLFIVSDRDLYSWTDFNWRFLSEDMEVRLLNLADNHEEDFNVYFNKASYLSSPDAPSMDWDIELEAKGAYANIKGILAVAYKDVELAAIPWTINEGQSRVTVRVSWPKTKIIDDSKDQEAHLIWRLERLDDAISLDNEMRTEVAGLGKSVLVVSDSSGEQILEDPAYQLMASLEVLDFRPKRFEWFEEPLPPWKDFPLWIILFGKNSQIENYCPKEITFNRLAASLGEQTFQSGMPRIWLAPKNFNQGLRQMCWCYHRIMVADSANQAIPEYCQNIDTQKEFNSVMRAMGASQVGGQIGREEEAFAWVGVNKKSNLEVIAFSLPLKPSMQTGISYARLPILMRSILQWQGFLDERARRDGNRDVWPRINNIVDYWPDGQRINKVAQNLVPNDDKKLLKTNVPVGESYLLKMDLKELPPLWVPGQLIANSPHLPASDDQKNPLPWIIFCTWFVIVILLLEVTWFGLQRLRSYKKTLLMLLISLAAFQANDKLFAKIEVSLLASSGSSLSLQNLAKDVGYRTSLSFDKEIKVYNSLDEKIFLEPWIWTSNFAKIRGSFQSIDFRVANWIKRGGFLVIENAPELSELQKLTKDAFSGTSSQGYWTAIPPDHEIMRSFYLLDSLPACDQRVWLGYMFDQRIAMLAIPYSLLNSLSDQPPSQTCMEATAKERGVRVFVNLLMVALATDYKKDQIHMREILKRLR